MEDETLNRCRTEFWEPQVSDRSGLDDWLDAGRPDMVTRAKNRWKALLAAHEDPALDSVTARQLKAYLDQETS
jgi:trimethylamine--corrinoid protein Co-methyltransferase